MLVTERTGLPQEPGRLEEHTRCALKHRLEDESCEFVSVVGEGLLQIVYGRGDADGVEE